MTFPYTSTLPAGLLALTVAAQLATGGSPSMASTTPNDELPTASAAPGDGAANGKYRVYVGTYTGAKSKGIYLFEMDPATGETTPPRVVAETPNPTFLAIHPNGKYLYAANEVGKFGNEDAGFVSAFAIDAKTGGLTPLNQQSSKGTGPCHLVVDREGKNILVANYGGGNVAVLPIGRDGKLAPATAFIQHKGSSVDQGRQEGPHAHSINVAPDNRYAFAADLGLDKVLVYRFDAGKGTLVANDPPAGVVAPGSGPRHFAFHPSGKYAYVINEMLCTVTTFSYDAKTGALKELQTIATLPNPVPGNSTAEIVAHPSGKFLYGSNRGHNSIAMFAIDPKTGLLTAMGHEPTQGKMPRNFAVDPTGVYLLAENQDSDTIVFFKIDPNTGKLTPTGKTVSVPVPVCVKFLPVSR